MARPDKVADVAELVEEFRSSDAVVLTEYRGLSMAELTELRGSLGSDVNYTVVKNTLARRAAEQAGADDLVDGFTGPSAVAFVKGDPVLAAKGLRDFSKAHAALVLRGGLLSGRFLDAAEVAKLADLESREVLLSKLAGLMKASASQAVSLFAAPLSQTARVVDALRQQVEAAAAAEPAGPEAAPVEAETTVEPVDDSPATESAPADTPATESAADDTAEAATEAADVETN